MASEKGSKTCGNNQLSWLSKKRLKKEDIHSSKDLWFQRKQIDTTAVNNKLGTQKLDWKYPKGICCSFCKQPFHYRKNCPERIGKIEFMIKGTDGKTWNEIWFASMNRKQHATGDKNLFKNLENSFGIEANYEGFKRDLYKGKEIIKIFSSGEIHTIDDVYYISTLKRNILSVEKLRNQGLKVLFECDVCHITRDSLWKGKKKQACYDPVYERIMVHCWTCSDYHHAYMCPLKKDSNDDQNSFIPTTNEGSIKRKSEAQSKGMHA
ncbi:ARID DNA-binding domain-containing protein [Artemisia annua]|uniref:ARID DNA-binding domain-containing protein n=1 Tax=Artemisia annua TaxID=35608 RepID=A0A2U1NGP8_ARTAN|nr:ARID DNA-binding domain-containing protein [Artemisia annua]